MSDSTDNRPTATERAERAARGVIARLREAGYESYLVGGCVRDRLLGRPSKDYDVATAATPDEVQGVFAKVIPVGAQFGVCRVLREGVVVEVATFRADQGYADGRHPEAVRFTDAREDVLRRDFTVNGLLQDPDTDQIIDYVEGRDDLARGVIRAIGDPEERFAEDRLRMLRAVRFSARLGFAIDPATEAAIRRHAARIIEVSAERIRDELLKIVSDESRVDGFDRLVRTGLLAPTLPEVAALPDLDGALARIRAVLDALPPAAGEAEGLAALLHRTDTDTARAVGERLRLPRRLTDAVAWVVRDLPSCVDAPSWRPSRLKRLLRAPHAAELVALHAAEGQAVGGARAASARYLAAQQATLDDEALRPPPLLRGNDLAAMGYRPGPRFGEMLEQLETAQLDGELDDAEAARAFLEKRFGLP